MYYFAGAAITKDHKLGGLNNRDLLCHGSEGKKPVIKASTGLLKNVKKNSQWVNRKNRNYKRGSNRNLRNKM